MKLAVDVKKVIQEIDLDTGKTVNYLVFYLGGTPHKLPATEEQLEAAIYEARLRQNPEQLRAGVAGVFVKKDLPEDDEMYEDYEESSDVQAEVPQFVQQLIEEPATDDEVRAALFQQSSDQIESSVEPSVFSEVTGLSDEELSAFQTQGSSEMPNRVNVVGDNEGGADTFQDIMSRPQSDPNAPPNPRAQRKQNISDSRPHAKPKGHKEVIAALRARAVQVPVRGLPAHQVDEAGNPVVPKKVRPEATGFARYTDPSAPGVHVAEATAPSGFGADDDGFEQG